MTPMSIVMRIQAQPIRHLGSFMLLEDQRVRYVYQHLFD